MRLTLKHGFPIAMCAAVLTAPARAEPFFDAGFHASEIESKIANRDGTVSYSDAGLHLGLGARRSVSERADISFRLELDRIDSTTFLAVRAFDYRRHISERLALNVFLGAARLDLATPAYGWYMGFGVQFKQLVADWDLSLDLRFGDKVARDNLLPSDPQGGSPDNFHDVTGITLYLSRGFKATRND
ncbi:MAG: hypothetical protein PVF50_12915 [Gammaproteobacteria bacterium]|jgi:hypothetical protein